jgi:hypothetical protein
VVQEYKGMMQISISRPRKRASHPAAADDWPDKVADLTSGMVFVAVGIFTIGIGDSA